MSEPCAYGLALNGNPDNTNIKSRPAAIMFGVGKSTINSHRQGACSCPTKTDTAAPHLTGKMDLGPDGGEFIDVQTAEQVTDWAGIFKRFNLDPDTFEIVDDTVRMSTWQQSRRTDNGDRDVVNLYSYRAKFRRVQEAIDLPALYAEAGTLARKPSANRPTNRTTVVVWSDPQIGKTGSRGGTKELIERSELIRSELANELARRNPQDVIILDGGDGIEGFESGGSPQITNDLSLPAMLDLYAVERLRWIKVANQDGRNVTVASVPSNHSAWRNGKQNLGKPEDDFGLYVHKQVERVTDAAELGVLWERSAPYDESVTINVRGTVLGLVHGHQFAPGKAIDWWQGQAFGAQDVALADVLVTAHYHSFAAGVAGRNPASGKQRWWLGAPTLDNGSDWYRNVKGRDSDPGLMIFDITDDGFDLSSLTILT